MIRLLASVVILVLVAIEATAPVPNAPTLVALGMLLLALALAGGRRAPKTVIYRSPNRRYTQSKPRLPQ